MPDGDAPTASDVVGVSVAVAAALADTVTAAVLDGDEPTVADAVAV